MHLEQRSRVESATAKEMEASEKLDRLRTYNMEPSVVPPYVLDSVAKQEFEGDLGGDLFLNSVNNNWTTFLHTVGAALAPLQPRTPGPRFEQPNLEGAWAGAERLKQELNQESADEKKGGFWSFLRGKDDKKDDFLPKIRSLAKYWMLTEQRTRLQPKLRNIALYSPYLLVTLRSFMFALSAVALGLAGAVYKDSSSSVDLIPQQPSTIMAIVVQTIALVYLVYVMWDEYLGAPVGLRDPMGKIRLILLDLLFIIFSSANLSLAYNTLFDDRWVCVGGEKGGQVSNICERQRGLSAFLFIILCVWVITFTVSVFRVVERQR